MAQVNKIKEKSETNKLYCSLLGNGGTLAKHVNQQKRFPTLARFTVHKIFSWKKRGSML